MERADTAIVMIMHITAIASCLPIIAIAQAANGHYRMELKSQNYAMFVKGLHR